MLSHYRNVSYTVFEVFFLYICDIQFTKENKVYNHQVRQKHIYLGENKKIKKEN